MTDFHDISFPFSLAFGASGGPSRITEITQLASGGEHRNAPHAGSRRRYNAGAGIKTLDELHELITFFEARMGQLHSFRFRDPLDFKSCKPSEIPAASDQLIAMGDGTKTRFQLIKTYQDSGGHYERIITKPIAESLVIGVDETPLSPALYNLDDMSGEIIFLSAPMSGATLSAGFEFDVQVRFDTDHLDLALEAFGAGQAATIPLIEVLAHA